MLTHTHTQVISNSYFKLLKEAACVVGVSLKCEVVKKKLEEISINGLQYGSGAKAIEFNGKTRYIRITDIDENGNLKNEKCSPDKEESKYILNKGDILFARSGATVGKNYIHNTYENCIYAGYLIRLEVNESFTIPKYVYYCLNTSEYNNFINEAKSIASQPNINAKQYSNFEIPIPSLPVQEYVVSKLDKFDSIVNSITEGLPKEIELRQKQYEYYREKLLSFPKTEV